MSSRQRRRVWGEGGREGGMAWDIHLIFEFDQ